MRQLNPNARFDTLLTPLSIDVPIGDAITPHAVQYNFSEIFADALRATANHRGTTQQIADTLSILHNIEESPELKTMWDKYRKQFAYAKDIEYGQIMTVLKSLMK